MYWFEILLAYYYFRHVRIKENIDTLQFSHDQLVIMFHLNYLAHRHQLGDVRGGGSRTRVWGRAWGKVRLISWQQAPVTCATTSALSWSAIKWKQQRISWPKSAVLLLQWTRCFSMLHYCIKLIRDLNE